MKNSLVACYTLDGVLKRTYRSAKEASKVLRMHPRSIDKCIRGETKTANNLLWRRVDKDNVPKSIKPLCVDTLIPSNIPIAKIDEEGILIEVYPSIRKASKINNIDISLIKKILSKEYISDNFVNFRYLTDKEIELYDIQIKDKVDIKAKKIRQYTLDGKYIKTYKSIYEAAKALNKPRQAISDCLNKKYSTAYGFKWRYVNPKSKDKEKASS